MIASSCAGRATKGAVAALPEILDILETEARRVQAVRALCKAARVAANTEALLRLGARMLDLYAEEKSRRGLLDYDDLIQKSRKLVERDGAVVLVDPASLDLLAGSELDYSDALMGAHFTVRNPNAASACGCGTSFSVE